jgi:hypothetical protein
VAVTEQRDIAVDGQRPCDDPLRARRYLLDGLATGHRTFPHGPAGVRLPDLADGSAFHVAVVPFEQVGIDLGLVAVAGQLRGVAGAAQRADEDEREPAPGEEAPGALGLLAAGVGEREVGDAGVLPRLGPRRLAVTDQDDLVVTQESTSDSSG